MNLQEVYKELNTDIKGLTINEVENRIEQYGLNQVEHENQYHGMYSYLKPLLILLY